MKSVCLLTSASVAFCCAVIYWHVSGIRSSERFDLTSVSSGDVFQFYILEREIDVVIPSGEPASIGSFSLSSPDIGYHSGPIERDGSLEAVWVADVTNDKLEDLIVITRSAGSGGYTQIHVFEGEHDGYRVLTLPEISPKVVPGYMGHDRISVHNNKIIASFPTYHSSMKVRVDQQWSLEDGLDGKLPIKKKPDSNSDPSGKTDWITYDFSKEKWVK